MPKGSAFEDMARDAARSIDAAREAGQQMSFLVDADAALAEAPADGGRTPRGKGKATSQLRDWLAARGMRLPEQVLAELAGLTSREDAILTAMANAERVLAWAEAGATPAKGAPAAATLAQRLQVFQVVYSASVRAAEALLPYGLAKVTPDEAPEARPVYLVPVAPQPQQLPQMGDPAALARDVTPDQGRRVRPPPLPGEIERNQGLGGNGARPGSGEDRTE